MDPLFGVKPAGVENRWPIRDSQAFAFQLPIHRGKCSQVDADWHHSRLVSKEWILGSVTIKSGFAHRNDPIGGSETLCLRATIKQRAEVPALAQRE